MSKLFELQIPTLNRRKKMKTETLLSNLSLFQMGLAQNIFPKDREAQWVRGIFCFSWSSFYKFAMALKLYKYMYQIYYIILKLKVIIGCSQEWGGWVLPGRKSGCSRIICSLWSWNSLKIKRKSSIPLIFALIYFNMDKLHDIQSFWPNLLEEITEKNS